MIVIVMGGPLAGDDGLSFGGPLVWRLVRLALALWRRQRSGQQ